MHIISAEFIKSAQKPAHYPSPDFPEIAFAGRSNVGKSTLINVLVNRKHLVKTSKTPGRTQLINFFLINNALSLVDLPGYGYAKVPKSLRASWGSMVETYLSSRESLKGVVLILDIRRTPGSYEIDFIDWLNQQNIPCIPVLTKKDKLSKNQQIKQQTASSKQLFKLPQDFILFSGKTKAGKETIWTAINALLEKNER
jgi:GTP-binding protein